MAIVGARLLHSICDVTGANPPPRVIPHSCGVAQNLQRVLLRTRRRCRTEEKSGRMKPDETTKQTSTGLNERTVTNLFVARTGISVSLSTRRAVVSFIVGLIHHRAFFPREFRRRNSCGQRRLALIIPEFRAVLVRISGVYRDLRAVFRDANYNFGRRHALRARETLELRTKRGLHPASLFHFRKTREAATIRAKFALGEFIRAPGFGNKNRYESSFSPRLISRVKLAILRAANSSRARARARCVCV